MEQAETGTTVGGQQPAELSAAELDEHELVDLPNREAMTLIEPGLGLIEGNLVSPQQQPIAGPAEPPAQTLPDSSQLPAQGAPDSTELQGRPDPMPPQPAPEPEPQPYSPTETAQVES